MSGKLSIREVERLSYYDFMGYMGVPFFNIGGVASVDRLAESTHIGSETRVLEIGCGTGTNACQLAEKYGCTVVGIDVAEHMVAQARMRAAERSLSDRVTFEVGDAYHIDYPDASFDAVVTIFVSQFLDPTPAFAEFRRVLRPGGYLGVNEMYRGEDVPEAENERMERAEMIFRDLTNLPFTLRSPETWRGAFANSGFNDVVGEVHSNAEEPPYAGNLVEVFGGWGKLLGTLCTILGYAVMSGAMRRRFALINEAKKTFLKDRYTSRHVGYVLVSGRKSA